MDAKINAGDRLRCEIGHWSGSYYETGVAITGIPNKSGYILIWHEGDEKIKEVQIGEYHWHHDQAYYPPEAVKVT